MTHPLLGEVCLVCDDAQFLALDHCHEHDLIRGMLCRSCNAVMGLVDAGKRVRRPGMNVDKLIAHVSRCGECPPAQVIYEPRMQTRHLNFSIPLDVHSQAEATAALQGLSLREFVIEALTRIVEESEREVAENARREAGEEGKSDA